MTRWASTSSTTLFSVKSLNYPLRSLRQQCKYTFSYLPLLALLSFHARDRCVRSNTVQSGEKKGAMKHIFFVTQTFATVSSPNPCTLQSFPQQPGSHFTHFLITFFLACPSSTSRARLANWSEQRDSATSLASGDDWTIMSVLALEPSESCSKCVSFELRYGMCPCARVHVVHEYMCVVLSRAWCYIGGTEPEGNFRGKFPKPREGAPAFWQPPE